MEKLLSCPVCGISDLADFLSCKDFVASDEIFVIQKCNGCSFLFTNPRPSKNEAGKYYQSQNYISHASNKKGVIYKIYDTVRDHSIRQKLNLIKKYHTSGTLMDLGCGLGYFLSGVNKDKTFVAVGVDISEDAAKFIKEKFGIIINNEADLSSFPENSFDVITQWHVLEHVQFLNERMVELKRLLKKDGTLFIAVPNSNSLDAKYYGQHWDAYDVPRHLYHFNKNTFGSLMEKHGFKVVETKPLFFDAPYVSMRSEQHQKNSFSLIRGAAIGSVSNFLALFTDEYSSLLFVVKKT